MVGQLATNSRWFCDLMADRLLHFHGFSAAFATPNSAASNNFNGATTMIATSAALANFDHVFDIRSLAGHAHGSTGGGIRGFRGRGTASASGNRATATQLAQLIRLTPLLRLVIKADKILIACLVNNGAQVKSAIIAFDEDVLLKRIRDRWRGSGNWWCRRRWWW